MVRCRSASDDICLWHMKERILYTFTKGTYIIRPKPHVISRQKIALMRKIVPGWVPSGILYFIFYIFLKSKRLICLPIKTALHQMFGPISKYATHYGTFASWKDYFSEYPDNFGYFHRLVIHKRHIRRPHLFIINIHRLSRWFFICGHSPMFFAARKTRNTVCQLRGFVTCRPWTGQLDSSWVVRPFHPVSICMR